MRCIARPSAAPRRRACARRPALESAKNSADRGAELDQDASMISAQDNDNLQSAYHQAQADLAAAEAADDAARINLDYAHISAPIYRPHRQVRGHAGRAGGGQPARRAGAGCSSSTRSMSTSRNRARMAAAAAGTVGRRAGRREPRGAHHAWKTAAPIPLPGELQFSDVTVEPGTGSFLLRVLVPNPKNLLLPGMYVRATISEGVLNERAAGAAARHHPRPEGQRHGDGGRQGRQDRAAQRDDRARGRRSVARHQRAWPPGDRVIVEGLQKIGPGMPVQATEETEPAASSRHRPRPRPCGGQQK